MLSSPKRVSLDLLKGRQIFYFHLFNNYLLGTYYMPITELPDLG